MIEANKRHLKLGHALYCTKNESADLVTFTEEILNVNFIFCAFLTPKK